MKLMKQLCAITWMVYMDDLHENGEDDNGQRGGYKHLTRADSTWL